MNDAIDPHLKAEILVQALPHMLRYDEATVVVKYGGHAMGDEQVARDFARDVILLEQSGVNPVVVHGGGPQIGAMLNRLGIKSEFAAGLRVTDEATIEVVEMVLAGLIMWVRFSYPRFREDQLQRFAWKVLIPVSLLNIMLTAILKVAF